MARNPVLLSPRILKQKQSLCSRVNQFASLIVAVFDRISVEYTWRISSLSATQFSIEKSHFE